MRAGGGREGVGGRGGRRGRGNGGETGMGEVKFVDPSLKNMPPGRGNEGDFSTGARSGGDIASRGDRI